eukprot:8134315-Alexandrium_andersonii.AAC.1
MGHPAKYDPPHIIGRRRASNPSGKLKKLRMHLSPLIGLRASRMGTVKASNRAWCRAAGIMALLAFTN